MNCDETSKEMKHELLGRSALTAHRHIRTELCCGSSSYRTLTPQTAAVDEQLARVGVCLPGLSVDQL